MIWKSVNLSFNVTVRPRTGLSALLASSVPEADRYKKVTPASLKQVLMEGADRLRQHSMYLQGPGAANLQRSYELMQAYEPRVSTVPAYLDLASEGEKDYFWPHSSQPLYAKSMPLMVNFTILNGMGVTGYAPIRFHSFPISLSLFLSVVCVCEASI